MGFKRKLFGVFFIMLAFGMSSCDVANNSIRQKKAMFQKSNISQRVTFPESGNLFHSQDGSANANVISNLNIVKYVQITPPEELGEEADAAGVHFDKKTGNVYISYLTPGVEFGGGMDIIPSAVSECDEDTECFERYTDSFMSSSMDITTMRKYGTNKYAVAGDISSESDFYDGHGASLFALSQKGVKYRGLKGGNTVDVAVDGNKVFALTDKRLYSYSTQEFSLISSSGLKIENPHFRSIAIGKNKLFVLSGKGRIYRASLNGSMKLKVFEQIGGIKGDPTAIADMTYNNDKLYVPLNGNGFVVINAKNGKLIERVGGYTSSITTGAGYVFAGSANNSDNGVIKVYQWEGNSLDRLGIIELKNAGSQVNRVEFAHMKSDYYDVKLLLVANDDAGIVALIIVDKKNHH